MLSIKKIPIICSTLVLSWLFCWLNSAAAQEDRAVAFRVATDIYLDEKKPPLKQSLTLFSQGVYYDLEESENGLITVIDPKRNRIVLLDRQRMVKSTLSLEQLQMTVSNARAQAGDKISAVRDASYQTQKDGSTIATVSNDFIEYRAVTQSVPNPNFAKQFADFADWSSRLNAVTQPKLPPYLRMDLNRLISEHGAIPTEIRRVSRKQHGGKENVVSSRLMPVWQLSQDDHARIARCAANIAEFREVPEAEYWKPNAVAPASAQLPSNNR
jgi:hypothetical protein